MNEVEEGETNHILHTGPVFRYRTFYNIGDICTLKLILFTNI